MENAQTDLDEENLNPSTAADEGAISPANAAEALQDSEMQAKVLEAIKEIDSLVDERAGINSQIKSIIEGLEAKGINKHAFKAAMRYRKMDESQRAAHDLSYAICRASTGIPVQTDLLEAISTVDRVKH